MKTPRIFHWVDFKAGSTIQLSADASHHVVSVLRKRLGDFLYIFNGKGQEYLAEISLLDKRALQVILKEEHLNEVESPIKIFLGQGISRGEKMDFTIQKSVELGVFHITPLFTEYGNVHLDEKRQHKRQEHWQKIAINAAEQCGRTLIPEVSFPVSINAWPLTDCHCGFICDPSAKPLLSKIESPDNKKPEIIHLMIGTEGGFSEKEIIQAEQKGFQRVSLGPRILRTETAALIALTILQTRWGDM